jgi:hypothetical protein
MLGIVMSMQMYQDAKNSFYYAVGVSIGSALEHRGVGFYSSVNI